MARMHTRKRGKSKSKKPVGKSTPGWVEHPKEEIEEIVVKLSKEGHNSTEVGSILKNKHGIPSVKAISGKRVRKIMKEKGIKTEYPDDLLALIKTAVNLRDHMKANHKDLINKNALIRIESKIRRLVVYYKSKGVLDSKWFYNPDEAALLVK